MSTQHSESARILVVDDDREMLDFLSGQLGQRGFQVETAQSGGQAVEISGHGHFDLVICDLRMPLMDGIACMETLTHNDPSLQVIMISGEATVGDAVSAMKKGAYDFLQKPIRMESLLCLIEKAILKHRLDSVADLYEKSRDILSQLDLKELLEPAIRNAVSFFRAEQGCWMSFEGSDLRIASGCGLEDRRSQEAALAMGREAIRDPEHAAELDGASMRVMLRRGDVPMAVFLLRRASGVEAFSSVELKQATELARRLLDIVETSRLRRSLDFQLAELRRTYAELEESKNLLAQKEKLAKLGGLIAQVAHEINNPLTAVMGYANLLMSAETGERSKQKLSLILGEAERCSRMIADILNYARAAKPNFRWVRAQSVVDDTLQVLAPDLRREGVYVRVDAPVQPVGMAADADQIKQVLINLLKNAVQATRSRSPRRVAVEIEGDARCVRLTVRDNGHGIAPENLERVFEPYFTTKSAGEGTGLGLSVASDIVRAHHGKLMARSLAGKGAAFVIELPVAQPDDSVGHAA